MSAQIRRHWLRVKLDVHKDGRITDVVVIEPSIVEAFDTSVVAALTASNPTHPLPTEYRSPYATFILTFYFNETPR